MKLYRYSLALKEPLLLGGKSHRHRDGILVHKDGQWGDCAPLPSFSRETLTEALEQLKGSDLKEPLPSVGFATDLAPASESHSIPVNALLSGETKQMLARAEQLQAEGWTVFKLKVGRLPMDEDVSRVNQLSQLLGADGLIRLDANRAWPFAEAAVFAQAIQRDKLDYIEEPLKNPERLAEWAAQTQLPLALDESIYESKPLPVDGVVAWVVKPGLLGGAAACRQLAEVAAVAGVRLVFSSAFESGLGIARIARLAMATTPSQMEPAGLDTYSWLAEDCLDLPLDFKGGVLTLPPDLEEHINGLALTEIDC